MRKIKKGFLLCPVMGKTMAISTGELEKTFPAMIKMNEPATDIWKWIDAGRDDDEIYRLYASTYDIDHTQARNEVDDIICKMTAAGIFE